MNHLIPKHRRGFSSSNRALQATYWVQYIFATLSLISVGLTSVNAYAVTVSQEVLESLTTELTEDITYYRWQSKTSGEGLARLGTLNENTNKYFMNMTQNIAAGPGLYMANDAGSSSSYLPKKSDGGGNLIEIRIPKGTRFINVLDSKTSALLKKLELDPEKVFMQKSSFNNKPLLIQYSHGWFVGRDLTGIAKFEIFPSQYQTPESVREQYTKLLRDPPAAQQMIDQLKESNRGFLAQIMKDNDIYDPLTQELMGEEKIKEALKIELVKAKNAEDVAKLSKLMVQCVECRQLITSDEEISPIARAKIIQHISGSSMESIVSEIPSEWTLDYFKRVGPDSKESRWVLKTYVRETFKKHQGTKSAVDEMAPVLKEFARQGGSQEWKEDFAETLQRRAELARESGENPSPLKPFLDEFTLKDGEKAQAAQNALSRADEFYNGVKTLKGKEITSEQIKAALKKAESPVEVRRILDAVVDGESGALGKKVLKEVLLSEPGLYIRGGREWSVGKMASIFETYKSAIGIEPQEIYFAYLKKVPPDVRAREIADSYYSLSHIKWETREAVRAMILERLDELIVGVDDLTPIAEELFKVEVGSKKEEQQKLQLVRSAKNAEQLKSISPWISKSANGSKSKYVTRAVASEAYRKVEELGVSRFTSDQVLQLVDAEALKGSDQRRFYTQLIDNALVPNDLIQIYHDMERRSTLAKSDLALYLVRRMQILKPTQGEIDTLKRMNPRLLGINKIVPLSDFQCVPNLSRALSTVRFRKN